MPLNKHLCLVGRHSNGSEKFGIELRFDSIKELLNLVGWSYCVLSPKKYIFSAKHKTSGVCIVSFVNAWVIPLVKIRKQRIWLDAMDSRHLTISWQIKSKNVKNFFRATRSLFLGLFLRNIDLQTYITRRDMEADNPKSRCFVLPNRIPTVQSQPSVSKRFVMFGDWNYYPNRQGLMAFIQIVWLEGNLSNAGISLCIYGKSLPKVLQGIPGLKFLGYASLTEIFTEKSIFISPISIGSGLKNKTIMPLKAGCIVVSLPEGGVGIENEPNLITVNNYSEMLEKLKSFSKIWPIPKDSLPLDESLFLANFKNTIEQIFN